MISVDDYCYYDDRLQRFSFDTFRPSSLSYVIWLVVALLFSIAIYMVCTDDSEATLVPMQLVYYLVVFVHLLKRVGSNRENILSPEIGFIVMYTVVHLGYISLYTLNIIPLVSEIVYYQNGINKAMLAINIGLISFILGYELVKGKQCESFQRPMPPSMWSLFSVILAVLGVLLHVVGLFLLGLDVLYKYGYTAIVYAERYSSLWSKLALSKGVDIFIIGTTFYCLFSALKYKKLFKSKIYFWMVCLFVGIMILEGDRGPIFKILLVLIFVRHFFVKAISFKMLIILATVTAILFAGMAVARKVIFNPEKMFSEYRYKMNQGMVGWYSPFVEMGTSFNVLNITVHDIPEAEPYWKGSSWVTALVHVVPFLEGYTLKHGYTTWAPSTWVTTTYWGPERAGRAYTLAAEGYLNFGYPGVFIELFFFGALFRLLSVYVCKKTTISRAIIYIFCVGQALLCVRQHLNIFLAVSVQISVFCLLLDNLFNKKNEYLE